MINLRIIILGLMLLIFATATFGQQTKLEKPINCKSNLKVRGKFKTLSTDSSGGASFQVSIQVEVKNQTDENYLAIASYFKAKYCKEENMYVLVFDSKEHFKLNGIPQPERPINGNPRAIYSINRKTGKEILEVYKFIDGKIETRNLEIIK